MKKTVLALTLLSALPAVAKTHIAPPAPLPAQVTQAKTVFLLNGGGNDAAFDEFYQDVKSWGKYQIVGSPDQADIVLTLHYAWFDDGETSTAYYNAYTHQTNTNTTEDHHAQVQLSVYDARTKQPLWSTDDGPKSYLRWRYKKEVLKAVDRVVEDMKARSTGQ